MAIKVAISHKTKYKFDRSVSLSPHIFRLRPAPHSRTAIEGYTFKLKPENHFINWQQDPFGNYQARVVFPEKTTELSIEVEVIAKLQVINPFDFFVEEYAENFPFVYEDGLKKELGPYLEPRENGPQLMAWIAENRPHDGIRIVDFLVQLNQRIFNSIGYNIRMEVGVQTCEETLSIKSGSCRDSAWMFVQVLRHLGIAARFVSGYLVQLTSDIKSLDGPSGPEADFTDLHAWVEAYVPGAGWIGLDPTSGLFASEGHIPLCCTPDYASASPVSGATDVCEVAFEFDNQVFRIHEDPRVTKPYTEEQWARVMEVGEVVEKDLQDGDVRLTMGGEPTFISIDDFESPEWITAADGPLKRQLAYDLSLRLKNRFAQGGLLHFGQGKWYPGEPFPRWQYALYWRNDGVAIWNNDDLIAKEGQTKYTFREAEQFTVELAKYLGIDVNNITPAYEDPIYWAMEEGKLPVNVDPLKVDLRDSIERRTLAKLLEKGLNNPAGFVLPIVWNEKGKHWTSSEWQFKRNNCFLVPGNSAIGFRLPLKSLPEVAKERREHPVERSLFETLPPLGDYRTAAENRYGSVSPDYTLPEPVLNQEEEDSKKPGVEKEEEKQILFDIPVVKTALSVEERDGIVYIFLPPTDYLEHYLDLIASVEATAEKLKMPVRIEGYAAPTDYRIQKLNVTPDPGVIEVNIHPAKNWNELVDNISALYEEAFFARLGTDKFMMDGRQTGTGGGKPRDDRWSNACGQSYTAPPRSVEKFIDLLAASSGFKLSICRSVYWANQPGAAYR